MGVAFSETTGTLTNTTVTIAERPGRNILLVANPSDTVMTYRFGGTATATVGVPLAAGDVHRYEDDNCPGASVSIFCAGTSKAYVVYEA